MEKMDLHVHTFFSDGNMTVHEAIQTAREKKLASLAITDHFTTSWKQSIVNSVNFKNYDAYEAEIKKERELARFNCLIGLEIDMDSSWSDIKRIPFETFDLILFEYADSIVLLKNIAELLQELKLGAIVALAHNSYFKMANLDYFSKFLLENNVYFELNSRYLNYSDEVAIQRIKLLKNNGVKFTIGSDAHSKTKIGEIANSLSLLEKIDGFDNLIALKNLKL
jgi:histidinol phosphatase-like PHP family hydrolase